MTDISLVKSNLQRMLSMGATPEEIDIYASSTGYTPEQIKTSQAPIKGNPPPDGVIKQDYPKSRAAMEYIRPTLEMGGLVGGGMLGTGATPVAGTVAGAGLGYSMGSNAADRLEEFLGTMEKEGLVENLSNAVTDFAEGATYEMGGQVAGKVISKSAKYVWEKAEKVGLIDWFRNIKQMFPSMSDQGILLKAKDVLKEVRGEKGVLKESEEVLKRTGIKTQPTFAQKSGTYPARAHEQSMSAENAELAAMLEGADAQISKEGIANIEGQFTSKGEISDILSGVQGERATLAGYAEKLAGKSAEIEKPLFTGKGQQSVGKEIKETLKEGKKKLKGKVSAEFDKIPQGIKLDSGIISQTIKKIRADFKKVGGGAKTFPIDVIKQMSKALKKKKGEKSLPQITFENLRDWRSQISEGIRESSSGLNPNLKLTRRLQILKKGVDDTLDDMLKLGDKGAAKQYDKAKGLYIDYLNKYRKGEVGSVLEYGNLVGGDKVATSSVPKRFFSAGKMDTADDLVRTIGKEKAGKLIDDYAALDIVSRAGETGSIDLKSGMRWLTQNKDSLKKYGLFDKYKKIIQTRRTTETALAKLNDYNKVVASNILERDVGTVIKSLVEGGGKKGTRLRMVQLLNMPGIKGNQSAINGVKNGLKDYILKSMEAKKVDVKGNPIMTIAKAKTVLERLKPAMEVIYSSKQIQAFTDYHKLLQMIARNKGVSYSGGSTTAEKLSGTRKGVVKSLGRNIAQLAAVYKGKGWFFSTLKNLWGTIMGAPGKFSQQKIDALLTEAIVNPEVAETIMRASKGFDVGQQLNKHLLTLGAYTTGKTTRHKKRE